MPSYSVTEPHPTMQKYAHSGRGGSGNVYRTSTSSTKQPAPPTHIAASSLNSSAGASKFSSGRGGAGNIRSVAEKPIFSFDDELARQNTREQQMREGAVWHTGRGGAGNWASERSPNASRKDSVSSDGTEGSVRSGFFTRLSSTFDRK